MKKKLFGIKIKIRVYIYERLLTYLSLKKNANPVSS